MLFSSSKGKGPAASAAKGALDRVEQRIGDSTAFTPQWRDEIRKLPKVDGPCPTATGCLDTAAACDATGDSVVVGWEIHAPGTIVWLEDDAGNIHPLDQSYRRFRQDVYDAVGKDFDRGNLDTGFITRIRGSRAGQRIRLRALANRSLYLLAEVELDRIPGSPSAAAKWLFSIDMPPSEVPRRMSLVDKALLDALLTHYQASWAELPVCQKALGDEVANPRVSVIVPLYGRTDFVEHQLIEFAADPWFVENVQLIYVLDDPRIVESFMQDAERLYRIYRIPMHWIWGRVNRGFSGANNLGASVATGQYLLFLNSDVFPRQPGWLRPLVEVLETRPDLGAVGPRLLFADGSLQHAGMEFRRRDELGVWLNHHPNLGLDPALDPNQGLTIMPALTGACMMLRREDFDRVGGWDTGYLIGDFEDSDLCLKLRSEGLLSAYLPSVSLTHLERQSFKLHGTDHFRSKVVIYNAVRHQDRWKAYFDDAAMSSGNPSRSREWA